MKQPRTAIQYLLMGLVPYSRQNLKLVFAPHEFMNDLEKIARVRRRTLQAALYRAEKRGFVEHTEQGPRLTTKGLAAVKPFLGSKLKGNVKLMVIFDIPEAESTKRRLIRKYLKEFEFEPIQKSVWQSDYDFREEIAQIIDEFGLGAYVKLYECAAITNV
jgi:hypothetical protein